MNTTDKLLSFIDGSPSPFHAVDGLKDILAEAGFAELHEGARWDLEGGGKYFVTRNLSSVIAFKLPVGAPAGFMIAAAHSDSPTFKVKHNPETDAGNYIKINTERYGGMICSTWLDRPLSVAGRLVVETDSGIETRLVSVDRDMLVIPNVAIHMNRSINEGFTYNPAVDLVPLYASGKGKETFLASVCEAAGVDKDRVIEHDLFLYSRQKGTVWGADGEFFSSARIDDLQCAYSAVTAIAECGETEAIPVAAVFDNEEVGSGTKQGADSTFLSDVLARIADAVGISVSEALPSSMMLSADNAHAVHPNHPEYADGAHKPMMNGGIVIKYNANQLYTTDSVSGAMFAMICKKAGVPVQYFANRSDMRGGSTLGNISNAHIAMNTVDIGCAQLAMHSAYETAGSRDTDYMITAMRAFYESKIISVADGKYEIR